jgi:hypothetical protein
MSRGSDEATACRAWLAGVRWARGRRPTEEAAAAAFAAWWVKARLPTQQVPDDAPSWWHGHGAVGRRLYDQRGPADHRALDTLPLAGGYAPQLPLAKRHQGQFKHSVVTSNGDVFTIIGWWDRSGSNASSCFVVRGEHAYSSEAMVSAFQLHFPEQARRLAASGVQLVELPSDGPP